MIIVEQAEFTPYGVPRVAIKLANGAVWYINGNDAKQCVQHVIDFVTEQNSSPIFQARALRSVDR